MKDEDKPVLLKFIIDVHRIQFIMMIRPFFGRETKMREKEKKKQKYKMKVKTKFKSITINLDPWSMVASLYLPQRKWNELE